MGIDFLGRLTNDIDKVVEIMKKVCVQKVASDGIIFDAESVNGRGRG
jgi:hypothetical protein